LALLHNAGLVPKVQTPNFDERSFETTVTPHHSAAEKAMALALEKARLISLTEPDAYVIGADQILDCDGDILHKATTRSEAEAQLSFLSGRRHRLTSAVAICRHGASVFSASEEAQMSMRLLSRDVIARYCDVMGEGLFETVGGYELEGLGVHLFDRIEGSFFAILGLPLESILAFFRSENCLVLR
jgi:septum formation protein